MLESTVNELINVVPYSTRNTIVCARAQRHLGVFMLLFCALAEKNFI